MISRSNSHITRCEALTADVPLAASFSLGARLIERRGYAFFRVWTDHHDGLGFSLTRDLPLEPALRAAGAALVGASLSDLGTCVETARAALRAWDDRAVAARALSIVEIALQDAAARADGVPLWQALGGSPREVPVVIVAGYPRPELTPEQLGQRITGYLEAGYPLAKISRRSSTDEMRGLLSAAGDAGRLVVDVGNAWSSAEQAVAELEAWGAPPLAWLEDPFPPTDTESLSALRRKSIVRLGVGDDVTDETVAESLIPCVDVLRVDATTIGGVAAALRATARAAAAGIPVSAHVYPSLHVHLALAADAIEWIESFEPRDNPFDPLESFFEGALEIAAGRAAVPRAPGLGLTLDLERLARYRVDGG